MPENSPTIHFLPLKMNALSHQYFYSRKLIAVKGINQGKPCSLLIRTNKCILIHTQKLCRGDFWQKKVCISDLK